MDLSGGATCDTMSHFFGGFLLQQSFQLGIERGFHEAVYHPSISLFRYIASFFRFPPPAPGRLIWRNPEQRSRQPMDRYTVRSAVGPLYAICLIGLVYGMNLFYSLNDLHPSSGCMARLSAMRMRLWLIADYRFFIPLPAC